MIKVEKRVTITLDLTEEDATDFREDIAKLVRSGAYSAITKDMRDALRKATETSKRPISYRDVPDPPNLHINSDSSK